MSITHFISHFSAKYYKTVNFLQKNQQYLKIILENNVFL